MRNAWLLSSVFSLVACGGNAPTVDAGGHDAGADVGATDMTAADLGPICHVESDCDDGVFCNGASHCMPSDPLADARGCTPTAAACIAGQTCDEASRMCLSDCAVHGDADGDGHRAIACMGDDCDDGDAARYPGNTEVCDAAGRDEDCNAATLGPDHDGDGYPSTTCCNRQDTGALLCGSDCDDTTMDVSPSAPEVCDGLDDNCNGTIDEGVQLTFYRDVDGDHYGDPSMTRMGCSSPLGYVLIDGDCNDGDASIHPGATEVCDGGIDNDCDGIVDPSCPCTPVGRMQTCGEPDGSGGFLTVGPCHPGVETCTVAGWSMCAGAVFPAPAETCNGIDDDCNGTTDEGVQDTYYRDADGDGYGLVGTTMRGCSAPVGYALIPGDCDDTRTGVNPGASETCNGLDDNCNGTVDEMVTRTYYVDADGDGHGVASMTMEACVLPAGYALVSGDCDDANALIHPGVSDVCDGGIDNDCDGVPDPGCMCTTGDIQPCGTGDGGGGFLMVGACHPGIQTCGGTSGWGACVGNVSPMAESCNGVDDDCDGAVDDGVTTAYYRDADGDGFGLAASTVQACSAPAGYALGAGDCDDTRVLTHPGATETCDLVDDDCNGLVDEGVTTTFYRDADGDGYGTPTTTTQACAVPAGYAASATDCNDANGAIHPGAPDGPPTCDAIDNNCDGTVDPGCTCVSGATQMCGTSDGMGGFLNRGICHPGSQTCSGGAWGTCMGNVAPVPESCNGLDDDCNGVVDNGVLTSWYPDCDGDGYGASTATPMTSCAAPGTPPTCGMMTGVWVANGTDCNDATTAIRPGAAEPCDGIDNDCDGTIDGSPANAWCLVNMPLPNAATEICTSPAHTCVLGTCASPFGDCVTSGSGAAGCETDLSSNYQRCGTCGAADCTFACVSSACVDATAVDAGYRHTCSVRSSGGVLCWGRNIYGELGDGTTTERHTPFAVSGISTATAVSAGDALTCARLATGAVMCWGRNNAGQLGNGTTVDSSVPVTVTGLTATQISAGGYFACSRSSSTVRCWGDNSSGQLGDGTTTSRSTPATVSSLSSGATWVSAGANHACAVKSGGTVVCWGSNSQGQLGNGTTTSSSVPVTVSSISDAVTVGAGLTFSCALRSGGGVSCWGYNIYYQLGDGTMTRSTVPVAVAGLVDAVELSVGDNTACARRATNGIVCWGYGRRGDIGDGGTADRSAPSAVSGITNASQITSGDDHSCAYLSTGGVKCWGYNVNGQIGDGTVALRPTPVAI